MPAKEVGIFAKVMAVLRAQAPKRSSSDEARISFFRTICTAIALGSSMAVAAQPPEIVAQGFDIAAPRQGIIGQFPRVRIRIEAPERISELRIKERSYEVDLATTLERSNLQLFGLDKRARRHRDLTLNFQKYINTKLDHEGEYEVLIQVVDEEAQLASALLKVLVRSEDDMAEQQDRELESDAFKLQRVGSGRVTGTRDFGVEWETIESERVTIRLKKRAGGATFLSRLTPDDYDSIVSRDLLTDRIENAVSFESIDIVTAGNAASGEIIAVVHEARAYLLSIQKSETETSKAGTVVTLIGEYRNGARVTPNSLRESSRDE